MAVYGAGRLRRGGARGATHRRRRARLNPALPPEAQADVIRRLNAVGTAVLLEENRRIHRLFYEGADVEYYAEDGTITAGKVRLINFDDLAANSDWLATGFKFTVIDRSNSTAGPTWWCSSTACHSP